MHSIKFLLIIISFSLFNHNIFPFNQKVALIIGNAGYIEQNPLRNPVNDADSISYVLEKNGFKVILKHNLSKQEMDRSIKEFTAEIKPGDIALFYYSGHGSQINGINYLIPIDATITVEEDMKYDCISADMILEKINLAGPSMTIMILDACRNNPFKNARSANLGLAPMALVRGSFISFATAPGRTAQDGTGSNSPFTKNLLQSIKIPGLKLEEVFKKNRELVIKETYNDQIPWESTSITGDFYFINNPDVNNKSSMKDELHNLLSVIEYELGNNLNKLKGDIQLFQLNIKYLKKDSMLVTKPLKLDNDSWKKLKLEEILYIKKLDNELRSNIENCFYNIESFNNMLDQRVNETEGINRAMTNFTKRMKNLENNLLLKAQLLDTEISIILEKLKSILK